MALDLRRHHNIARTARDEARSRRAVLIVTRTAFDATQVMEALECVLRPRDGQPKLLRSQGLWQARSEAWGTGTIDVRVQGPGVRGMGADTLLLADDVSKAGRIEARPCTHGSASPIVAVW